MRLPLSSLAGLRIGCVRYLNARPLIEPYLDALASHGEAAPNVHFDHPSALAAQLSAGELDIALVPLFEALRSPESPIIKGVSISATGPVWSVFVAHKEEDPAAITDIVLDPASLTSANLCRVLFAERQERQPRYHREGKGPATAARLLIGNQAIEFRDQEGDCWHYLDLAQEWQRLEGGLPFVFAVWLMRPDLPPPADPGEIAAAFRCIAAEGLQHVETIAARHASGYAPGFSHRYLTEHIRFGMGPQEKQAMARFRELLIRHNRLQPELSEKPFIFV